MNGAALARHLADDRFDARFAYLPLHRGVPPRRRAVAAHPTRVRAPVAVEYALVVAGGHERRHVCAVREAEDAQLLADEALLDNDALAGRPECAVYHRVAHGFERLVDALRDHDTLARGEAVRLDDDGRALRAHVLLCGVRVVEDLERWRRSTRVAHDAPGERFAALDAGGGLCRSEDAQPFLPEAVNDADGERQFRPDDGEVDAVLAAQRPRAR